MSQLSPEEALHGVEVGSSVQAEGLAQPHALCGTAASVLVVCSGLAPSLAPLWSPVQRQIQEEPLDSLSSTVRWQAMETLTQLRCPQPPPGPPALSLFPWAPPLSPGACPQCPTHSWAFSAPQAPSCTPTSLLPTSSCSGHAQASS